MDKPLIERLHLYDGNIVLLKPVEIIVDDLSELDLNVLKRLYAVYTVVCDDIEAEIISRELSYETSCDGVDHLIEEVSSSLVDGFLAERFSVDYRSFLDDVWESKLSESRSYVCGIDTDVLEIIAWKSFLIASMIESLIMSRDEYWYPNHKFSVYLLHVSGFSIEKKKERIWQPKTS